MFHLKFNFSDGDEGKAWIQVLAIILGCLTSLNVGFHLSWTSPSIPLLISNQTSISISFEECSYLPIIQNIAIIVSCPIFAVLVDLIGRKHTILLTSVPQFVSWLIIAFARTKYELFIAKGFAGIGDAAMFTSLPFYIGEIAQPKLRGTWGNGITVTIYLGQLLINVIGNFLDIHTTAAVCSVSCVVHLALFFFMPESPYFLLMKGKQNEAEESLKKLRWKQDVRQELKEISASVQRQVSSSGTLKDLFTNKINRRAILIAFGIRCTQQFSGLPAFSMYAQYMFEAAGGSLSAEASSITFYGVMFVLMTLASFLLDKAGRRFCLILSAVSCSVMLLAEGVYFFISDETDIDTSAVSWFPLAGMLLYLIAVASGLGTIPTLMLGELFSASIKGKASSLMGIVLGVSQISTSKLFQSLAYNFGLYTPFLLFSFCCLCGTVFCWIYAPETSGKTLEEIQQDLLKSKERMSN